MELLDTMSRGGKERCVIQGINQDSYKEVLTIEVGELIEFWNQ
jgi:hypothetical protein